MRQVNPKSKVDIQGFLSVFDGLYPKAQKRQDKKSMRKILSGTHALSEGVKLEAFWDEEAKARGIWFYYKEEKAEKIAYFGFLEAKTPDSLLRLLKCLETRAKEEGFGRLIGPVDLSFWNSYRLRESNTRNSPFTSEPWQQAFYQEVIEELGYKKKEKYLSFAYSKETLAKQEAERKSLRRYEEAIAKGYRFESIGATEWEKLFPSIFSLLSARYQDFPMYRPISYESFHALYAPLKYLVDFEMLEIVRLGEDLVAFLVTVPDYGSLLGGEIRPRTLPKILWKKHFPKAYVMLYMAVAKGHEGLGLAMSYRQFQKVKEKKKMAYSALIHKGKHTAFYERSSQGEITRYYLYEKEFDHAYNG